MVRAMVTKVFMGLREDGGILPSVMARSELGAGRLPCAWSFAQRCWGRGGPGRGSRCGLLRRGAQRRGSADGHGGGGPPVGERRLVLEGRDEAQELPPAKRLLRSLPPSRSQASVWRPTTCGDAVGIALLGTSCSLVREVRAGGLAPLGRLVTVLSATMARQTAATHRRRAASPPRPGSVLCARTAGFSTGRRGSWRARLAAERRRAETAETKMPSPSTSGSSSSVSGQKSSGRQWQVEPSVLRGPRQPSAEPSEHHRAGRGLGPRDDEARRAAGKARNADQLVLGSGAVRPGGPAAWTGTTAPTAALPARQRPVERAGPGQECGEDGERDRLAEAEGT